MQEGFKKTVFPSLKPARREDVALLKHWLADTMQHLSVLPPRDPQGGAALRDARWGRQAEKQLGCLKPPAATEPPGAVVRQGLTMNPQCPLYVGGKALSAHRE